MARGGAHVELPPANSSSRERNGSVRMALSSHAARLPALSSKVFAFENSFQYLYRPVQL
jgi:hypothetical protein